MKKTTIIVKNGKMTIDFENFPGKSCQHEENTFRLLLGIIGLKTDVEHSDNKPDNETNYNNERERQRS